MAIKRTFRRKAKNGYVKADGQLWDVTEDGQPYTGDVVLRINCASPDAYREESPVKAVFLTLECKGTLHETNIPRTVK